MSRTLVIGDIHGAYKALRHVLERAQLTASDKLIFLGDYVDGWSQSAEVIDYLIYLDSRHECIFIRDNHDAWCECWLTVGEADNQWLFHGGESTLNSYRRLQQAQMQSHCSFFNRFRNYYIDEQNRLFIHAGFSSMHGPAHEHYQTNFSWDRTLWEVALTMDRRIKKDSTLYPKRLLLFNEIYIGHTPTISHDIFIPMQGCNVWNVDTGAAFHGKLTAMDIDTKQFWQSDIVQEYYPNEKGRNK